MSCGELLQQTTGKYSISTGNIVYYPINIRYRDLLEEFTRVCGGGGIKIVLIKQNSSEMKRTRGVDNPRAQELCLTPNSGEDIKS